MSVILVHPTGNQNVRAALRGLHRAGLLVQFITSVMTDPDRLPLSLLPTGLRRELSKRAYPDIPDHLVQCHPLREVVRRGAERLGWRNFTHCETGWASVDAVYHALDRAAAAKIRRGTLTARTVYCYDDGALETFRAAGERSMLRLYELPTVDWRTTRSLLAEEAELQPAWASTLGGLRDSREKLARKDAEIGLADAIIVPCGYAREGLLRSGTINPARVHLIPYGAPPVSKPKAFEQRGGESLAIVYVGHLGQRKGISYLLDAVHRLDRPHRLTLIGSRPKSVCKPLEDALQLHTWIPQVPHAEVLKLMRQQDVMVFPSLCEGFGLVILEAMAQGVPVITTPHTGGPDVIEDGVDGFIVPIRDSDAIADRLARLADDRDLLHAMGDAARRKVATLGWERYEAALVTLISAAIE